MTTKRITIFQLCRCMNLTLKFMQKKTTMPSPSRLVQWLSVGCLILTYLLKASELMVRTWLFYSTMLLWTTGMTFKFSTFSDPKVLHKVTEVLVHIYFRSFLIAFLCTELYFQDLKCCQELRCWLKMFCSIQGKQCLHDIFVTSDVV